MSREIEYFSIGRVSRLMGTSSQMIREYERAGLIKSMRAENNYRQFVAPDLTYLLYYKSLRCLGFSTKDILELTAEIDRSRNMERLDAKYLEIEQQIKELQMKLSILGSKKDELQLLDFQEKRIHTTVTEPFYWFPFRRNEFLYNDSMDDELLGNLISKLPHFSQCLRVSGKNIDDPHLDYETGIALPDRFIDSFSEDEKKLVKEIPGFVCFTTVIRFQFVRRDGVDPGFIEEALEESGISSYIRERGYHLVSEIFCMDVHHSCIGEKDIHYWRVFFPVMERM